MLSIIVPVFYKSADSYIVIRAKEIIKKFANRDDYELIISDSSKLQILNSNMSNVKIVNTFSNDKYFSPALARNKAVKYATKKYLFFYDVDLDYDAFFEQKLLVEIKNELVTNRKKFLMIPCLYLSQKGTEHFIQNNNVGYMKESFLKGENGLVSRIALNTSALIMEKNYFLHIGSFSEDFKGHGGEDFELLHRLAALNPHSKRNIDYYSDRVEQFPANYIGFRRYLAYYALPHLFTELVLVHKWHERPLTNLFYFRRRPNELMMQAKMRKFDNYSTFKGQNLWNQKKLLVSIDEYVLNLMEKYGYYLNDFPGLFKFKNGVVQPKSTFGAKTRKFITRPKAFLLDSKLFNCLNRNIRK